MSVLFSLVYRFNAIPINISQLFYGYREMESKVYVKSKRFNSMLKENKVGRLTLPDFKTYSKDTIIKIVMVLAKEQTDPWNRKESSKIGPHKYSQLISQRKKGNTMEQR